MSSEGVTGLMLWPWSPGDWKRRGGAEGCNADTGEGRG